MSTVWIVGQRRSESEQWEFQGVFDNEDAAKRACRSWKYFVGPATINQSLPDEKIKSWPGCYYPIPRTAADA